MSRIAKNPIKITKEIECSFNGGIFSVKGKLGRIEIQITFGQICRCLFWLSLF